MASESNPKKRINRNLIVIALLLGLLALWCNNASQSRNYPFYVASRWQCNDPNFTLSYENENNDLFTSYEVLEWENELIKVNICFLMWEYEVFPVGSSDYSNRLFSGTWKYRNGDFVLTVEEDFIFNNKYHELVFSPVT